MAEYIKREDAIDAVLDVYYNTPDIDLNGEQLEAAILKVQPADIVPGGRLHGVTYEDGKVTSVHIMDTDDMVKVFSPVVHGRWIRPHWKNSNYCCDCSECGGEAMHREYQWDKNGIYPICPNCGARMA